MVRGYLIKKLSIIVLLFVYTSSPCKAYSVLTHEAIIDAGWEKVLLPLLKQKYPGSSAAALKEAHAYAYGGAVVPDMGYYPFSSKLFTNLVHYVRSGDFVEALLNDAQDVNEYAFALGVLCHYCADIYGHSIGINPAVPEIYPKMKSKFGDTVTFAENRISHIRTEFAFDVLQTARGNYASIAYHDFIGFQVAQPLLERAFRETYGLDINELFGNFPKAVRKFRWAIMNLFPFITKTAWVTKKDEIKKITPNATSRNFIYRMHRKNYRHQLGDKEGPKFFAHVVSFIIRIMPKIGPLRVLKFRAPGPDAEKLFIKSFDTVTERYTNDVKELQKKNIYLGNIDFDTGLRTKEGEYKLADQSYRELLLKLKDKNFETLTFPLKQHILSFYSNEKTIERPEVMEALAQLKTVQPVQKN